MKKLLLFLGMIWIAFSCQSVRQTASSARGVVAAGQPLATQAGTEMLSRGGNAVDAAVSTAFVLSVVEPSMSGLGGRLQAIIRLPNGEIRGVDATSQSPINYDTAVVKPTRYGYRSIGVPGVVAGLCQLQEDYGRLSLATVMAPAIAYAEKGFELLPGEAKRHAAVVEELKEFEGGKQYFLKADGNAYAAGDRFVQKDLANTLKKIAEGGKKAFYEGAVAEQMVKDMQAKGGLITLEDLKQYEAKKSKIISGSYRGYDLHGLWLPSFGAITIEILHILENLPMHALTDEQRASAFYQAMALAYEDRRKQYVLEDMPDKLTSKAYAKELAARIKLDGKAPATSFRSSLPESWTAKLGHTTHLSAADASGMTVALTQSLGPNMGSKVAAPGLGFLYAVSLGPYLGIYKPGQRVSSHISPFLITKDGEAFMGLGAAGGSRIVTAVAQVSSRVIDQQLPLPKALAAPRVHPDRDTIILETHAGPGWPAAIGKSLRQKGFYVEEVPESARFGRVHAVMYDAKKKRWTGAADPDWEGAAAGPGKKR